MTTTEPTFDLDEAIQQTSADLVLKHPKTGAPIAAVITLAGPEHPVRKQRLFALMRRRRAQFEKEGRLITSDPTEDEADELDMLVACTLGWRGISIGGQALVFNPTMCKEIYADPARAWLRAQVKTALDQRELFIGGSALA